MVLSILLSMLVLLLMNWSCLYKLKSIMCSMYLSKFTETPPFASFVLPPILNGQVIRSRLNLDNLENRLRMHVREFSDNQV